MAKSKHTNITSWKPGQSGNPKGRPPKGYSISEMVKEMFNSNPNDKELIGQAIIRAAKKGDIQAIKLIWQYMDGMPQQHLDHTSRGEKIPLLDYTDVSKQKDGE